MKDKKKEYLAPTVEVKAVEIESSICGGSVDIANPEGSQGEIEEQKVNTNFNGDFSGSTWDEHITNSGN